MDIEVKGIREKHSPVGRSHILSQGCCLFQTLTLKLGEVEEVTMSHKFL